MDGWIDRWLSLMSLLTFESVVDARRAKLELNGADIYAGCCTLKIEYARVNTQTHTHTGADTELKHARVVSCAHAPPTKHAQRFVALSPPAAQQTERHPQ